MYDFLVLSFLALSLQSCDYVTKHACVTSACGWKDDTCVACTTHNNNLIECKSHENCYYGLNNTCRPSEIVYEETNEEFGFGVFIGITITIVMFIIVYFIFRPRDEPMKFSIFEIN